MGTVTRFVLTRVRSPPLVARGSARSHLPIPSRSSASPGPACPACMNDPTDFRPAEGRQQNGCLVADLHKRVVAGSVGSLLAFFPFPFPLPEAAVSRRARRL